jgi:hypothetical protein
VPFHAEQFRLSGMGDEEIQEAAAATQFVTGFSDYLAGLDYSVDQYKEELAAIVKHIKSQSG